MHHRLSNTLFDGRSIWTLFVLDCDQVWLCDNEVGIISRPEKRLPVPPEPTFLALPIKGSIGLRNRIGVPGTRNFSTNGALPEVDLRRSPLFPPAQFRYLHSEP